MKTRVFLLYFMLITISAVVCVPLETAALPSGIINGNGVNLRADPGLYGQIIFVLGKGLLVDILERAALWYKVQLQDGQTGWIYHQYIEVKTLTPDDAVESIPSFPADELIAYARSFLEIKYVYGGDSPQGFDCSGFTKHVFAKFGINLPHKAEMQTKAGAEVPAKDSLMPGDLLFFKTMGSTIINHVGIYLGENHFIHASSGYGAVRISPLDSGYYLERYAGGRSLR
jgi:uncharacterized protein YgiM (DUF1202 family)